MALSEGSMVKVVAFVVFFEQTETSSVWVLNWIDDMIGFCKINLIIVSNNLTLRLCLQGHFDDISGLVIKETVGVTKP